MQVKIPKVYFSNCRENAKLNNLKKLERLFHKAGFDGVFQPSDRTAVKIHWGEPGNTTYIPVPFARTLVSLVRGCGARPFLTDTSVIYKGGRSDALLNLEAAAFNGFTMQTIGAPLIIADGLCGTDSEEIEVGGKYVKTAKIAGAIRQANSMLVISHFKGHSVVGYGGALKNLGMGCATSAGKQVLHSDVRPKVDAGKCRGDSLCIRNCPANCIVLNGELKAVIDQSRCIGCGECAAVCPEKAIPINWATTTERLQGKTAEYAFAAVKDKQGKAAYISVLMNMTADCDCYPWSDNKVIQDIGFLASTDPVAIDKASIDLFNGGMVLPGSMLEGKGDAKDKLKAMYPNVDYGYILRHAQETGLGSMEYELVKVDV